MKISDLQFENFLKVCKETNEFLFGDLSDIRGRLEEVLESQAYWSGVAFRYYLDGDDWRTETRTFGK